MHCYHMAFFSPKSWQSLEICKGLFSKWLKRLALHNTLFYNQILFKKKCPKCNGDEEKCYSFLLQRLRSSKIEDKWVIYACKLMYHQSNLWAVHSDGSSSSMHLTALRPHVMTSNISHGLQKAHLKNKNPIESVFGLLHVDPGLVKRAHI